MSTWSYDSIADIYVTDMGRSMPFDDVGFYARACIERGGRALELGCGTGRITIELAARGVDVVGIDRSLPMLKRARVDAAARGIALPLARMDLAALGLAARFRTILLPYSLITYVTDRDAASALLRGLASLLESGGRILVDAFVPRPVESFSDFRRDYRREHADGFLEREKRIALQPDGTSVIERRYRLLDVDQGVRDEFVTVDRILPYAPDVLEWTARSARLHVVATAWDYGTADDSSSAQFCTLVLARNR